MAKNVLKIAFIFIFGMAGGIFADQIFWPYFVERPLFYEYRLDRPPIYVAETKEVIIRENAALTNAVANVSRVVAGVRTQTAAGRVLEGSGLVVTSDGLMVTLAELVPAGSVFNFSIDGQALGFQVLRRDLTNNLALVRLEGANFDTVGFADFGQLLLGERVFLVGNTHDQKGSKLAAEGIVRALGEDSLQTTIFEQTLASGSPLFNIEGRVLGLVSVASSGRVSAIPITKIRAFLGF
ncbi:MAG: hypothetical protein G01um101430_285 [Parcubacteria group bacterium Gr01-1014_30]|nr:MAG: hypothetical protein G01um101430_285 [Parcubacteria group bacterium Gr01-1014_30]